MLAPGNEYLEVIIKDKILKVEQYNVITGDFRQEDLAKLFCDEVLKNSMCILSKGDHAITLFKEGDHWVIHDPLYINVPEKFLKRFASEEEAFAEIGVAFGDYIFTVESVSFEKNAAITNIFENFYNDAEHLQRLLATKNGFREVWTHGVEYMEAVLERGIKNEDVIK